MGFLVNEVRLLWSMINQSANRNVHIHIYLNIFTYARVSLNIMQTEFTSERNTCLFFCLNIYVCLYVCMSYYVLYVSTQHSIVYTYIHTVYEYI